MMIVYSIFVVEMNIYYTMTPENPSERKRNTFLKKQMFEQVR